MGHEAIGVVEDVGSASGPSSAAHVVIMPFANSDGSCMFCEEGLQTACVHVGFFGNGTLDGAQAEAMRIPYADGTLYPLNVGEDDALMPSLLTLVGCDGDGPPRGCTARVRAGGTVAVVGDGAVGICGVIAAKRLGAEQIIIMGRHADRIALAKEFGATDVVSERGEEGNRGVRAADWRLSACSRSECVGASRRWTRRWGSFAPGGAVACRRASL